MCIACLLEAQHAWKLAKAGPAPALCSPHPHHPSALSRKEALDSFGRDPRSGLALLWHGGLELREASWTSGAQAGKLSSLSHREARCCVGMLMREVRMGVSIGGKITTSEWIEGV